MLYVGHDACIKSREDGQPHTCRFFPGTSVPPPTSQKALGLCLPKGGMGKREQRVEG